VLGLWSGLGYYSRARNLHRCAQLTWWPCMAGSSRAMPRFANTARHWPLYGGGDRIVLFWRACGHSGRQRQARAWRAHWDLTTTCLWLRMSVHCGTIATRLLPAADLVDAMPRYTQGLMDLGATVCLRATPTALLCPVAADVCGAARGRAPELTPSKRASSSAQRSRCGCCRHERPMARCGCTSAQRPRRVGRPVLPAHV
jgi:A/G-specific adenine glycosylase